MTGLQLLAVLCYSPPVRAYSVLTHEAIIDSLWDDSIRPALLKHFPESTEEQLREAHAYAYGGCIIQDLGYYPFGNHFFSDLLHYVRSGDFLEALVEQAQTRQEYAFALGAVAHYGADVAGHSTAVNRAVPLMYPKLRKKFGDVVTYADDPAAHLKTEFGFDVLQVARGHYAPQAYHDFIGFQVSRDLLDRAFQKTYGLTLKDLFPTLDLAFGTYRFSVSRALPAMTMAAWSIKRSEIEKENPGASRRQFVYNIKRAGFEKEWGTEYQRPGFGARFLAFLFHLIPKVGPFRAMAFNVPTPETEKLFENSFDEAIKRDRQSFTGASADRLRLSDRDLDTGNPVSPGEYLLTDKTYDKLLTKLAEKKFVAVTPELRQNILDFYSRMKTPDQHDIGPQLDALKAFDGAHLN